MTMRAARAIQAATCAYFLIDQSDLLGARRHRDLVRARHLAMFICRQRLGLSYPELGIAFGNRDHSTVINACSSIRERLDLEPAMRAHLRSVETLLAHTAAAAAQGTAMPVDRALQMSKGAEARSSAPEGCTNGRLGQEPASAPPAALGGVSLDWIESVKLEAAYQRERWGKLDAGKSPADWLWLLGQLGGKALQAAVAGDIEKAQRHTIAAGAALANWHLALSGGDTGSRRESEALKQQAPSADYRTTEPAAFDWTRDAQGRPGAYVQIAKEKP